ncbi:ubiquinol-cytochrome c reductase iron-sulfur subunit [Corticicoccus populi]|uniref:Ubiquinol-cytochrome c reductase iron-sulfur subunit n=1 Tax=Corticicoccus populi TaxID=1812821 RepID=A0ABW5WTL1_9STAP
MSQKVTRRQFLNYSLMGVGSFMAAGMLLPMGRFALDPLFKDSSEGSMVTTSVTADEITEEPTKVDFTFEQQDAWYTSEVTDFAWVYREGDEIIALSPVCKHLGCTVTWAADAANPERFFCPCHNGLYEKNGQNVPGTPPLGPLDQFEVGVSDGFITIGQVFENELV